MMNDTEKFMKDLANFAEDLVSEAELEKVFGDTYLIRVPKYEWQDLVEAVERYAKADLERYKQ